MKLRGKEIIVHRGETFTLDMNIKNRDGSPFIIDSAIVNPYLLISVASSKYSQSKRYLSNWWLDLSNIDKFSSTIPVKISDFRQDLLASDEGVNNYLYTDGKGTYKYWDSTSKTFKEYSFRVTKAFTYDITKEWVSRSYDYSITFIAGRNSMEYLSSVWNSAWGTMPGDLDTAWKIATEKNSEILEVLPEPNPICLYSDVLTFVEPSPLTVLADIRGSK